MINSMPKIAVFPGSFDPITKGHQNIVERALPLFDQIIIAIGENIEKKTYFSLTDRLTWIRKTFEHHNQVEVVTFSGLTVDFCKKHGAFYILRGLRTSADFEFERTIGQVNKKMDDQVETVFFLTAPEFTSLNSSVVREIHRYGGDISQFIPQNIFIPPAKY